MGPRLLNTSPLVVRKVILQRDDNVATQMLIPSVRSTSARLSLALRMHRAGLALRGSIGHLSLSYSTVFLTWDRNESKLSSLLMVVSRLSSQWVRMQSPVSLMCPRTRQSQDDTPVGTLWMHLTFSKK